MPVLVDLIRLGVNAYRSVHIGKPHYDDLNVFLPGPFKIATQLVCVHVFLLIRRFLTDIDFLQVFLLEFGQVFGEESPRLSLGFS